MSIFKSIKAQNDEEQQAKEIARQIESKIEEKLPSKIVATKKDTSIKQQVLILHYLGFLDKIDLPTIRKAKLLSVLLNKNEQDIKVCLTYIGTLNVNDSDIKTELNLTSVLKTFEEAGMPEVIKLIKIDLKVHNSL